MADFAIDIDSSSPGGSISDGSIQHPVDVSLAERQMVISEVLAAAQLAVGDVDLETLLHDLLHRLCKISGAYDGAAFLRHNDDEYRRYVHHPTKGQLSAPPVRGSQSPLVRAIAKRRLPYWVPDCRQLSQRDRQLFSPRSRATSLLALPLYKHRQRLGFFILAGSARTPLTPLAISRACSFAREAVDLIERCHFRQELREAALQTERLTSLDQTLRIILSGMLRVVPADAGGVLIRDGDYGRVIAVVGHPDEAVGSRIPIAGDVSLEGPLLRGESVRLHDLWAASNHVAGAPGAEQIRGYLAVPLIAQGAVIGVLCADSWSQGRFKAEDLRRVGLFAIHAASALQRAQQHAHVQSEARALREAALLATQALDMAIILPGILDGLCRVITCESAGVLLREGDHARIVAATGHGHNALDMTFPIVGQHALEATLLRGETFICADLSAEPGYVHIPGTQLIRGHLAVPLQYGQHIMGMVSVDSQCINAFKAEDVIWVELFAGYVAAALHNAREFAFERDHARTDALTGLLNYRALHEGLQAEVTRALRYSRPLSILFLDLDYFKQVNDTHGHPIGDAALRHIAGILKAETRSIDLVGRYGGEEFLVILPELDTLHAYEVAERVRAAVETHPLTVALPFMTAPASATTQPPLHTQQAVPLTVSVGTATISPWITTLEALLKDADAALYKAKHQGRNQVYPSQYCS